MNCIAYFDFCMSNNIESYPTTLLYHRGEKVDEVRGSKNIKVLSDLVERSLEEEVPGSRPELGKLSLPKPGATEWPPNKNLEKDEHVGEESDTLRGRPADISTGEKSMKEEPAEKPELNLGEQNQEGPPPENPNDNDKLKDQQPLGKPTPADGSKPTYILPAYPVPSVPKPTSASYPNPNGVSVPLFAESFRDEITLTEDPWFVKFYAPWCHHCQALAPTWEQVGKSMQGKLNIGEVNCDKDSRLCKDVGVSGYPTIYFFKGGERVEYEGLRGLGSLVKFTEKAVDISQGVQDVTLEDFEALEEKEEVLFVYFYDHAATIEDFIALERLPVPLIGRAKIVRTRDPHMYDRFKITTWPRLVVSREGRPTYYQPLTPRDMRDVNGILEWMKSVWLPIVPEMTAANAREIMDGKMVVLGILNRDETDSYQRALKEMKTAANEWMDKQIQQFQLERQDLRNTKQLRIEEAEDRGDSRALRQAKHIRINMDMSDRKQVGFAWVDGVFWQRWVRTTYGIDVQNGERVVINDEDVSVFLTEPVMLSRRQIRRKKGQNNQKEETKKDTDESTTMQNKRYWDETITGNYIVPSRTSILETLNKVTAQPPKIKPKLTISSIEKVIFDVKMTFIEHPYLSGASVTGFCLAAWTWYRGRSRRRGGGYFRVEDTPATKDFKGGLLGGASANGKAD